ncbi:hypothetical protein ACMH5Q_10510 [Aquirufa lenticrescens]
MRYLLILLCVSMLAGSCASRRYQAKPYKKKWSLFKKNACDCPNLR